MVDEKKFTRLAVLSKFDFPDNSKPQFIEELNDIIDFVGRVKDFNGEYDDNLCGRGTVDNKCVSYMDLREDVAISTATPEQLLANTQSENNCYVIPKVID